MDTASQSTQWRQMLAEYLSEQVGSQNTPHYQRWLWQSSEYEMHHTDTAIGFLEKTLGNIENIKIVDFGCGSGLDSINIARRGAKVTGIDVNRRIIEIARLRAAEVGVQVRYELDLDQLVAQEAGQYDALVSLDVMEHVADPQALYKHAIKLLRPGGVIVISTPNRWAIANILADPHWKLFGVVLMPRWLAQRYVRDMRKMIKEYDVWDFVLRRNIIKYLSRCGCDVIYDNVQECAEKLIDISNIKDGRLSKAAVILSRIARNSTTRDMVASIYTLIFRRSWWVIARKNK